MISLNIFETNKFGAKGTKNMATLADVGAVSILYMCTYAATVLVLVILKLRRTIGMLYNTIPVLLNELSWKASVVGSSLVCIN